MGTPKRSVRPRVLTYGQEASAMELDYTTSERATREIGEEMGSCDTKKAVVWGGFTHSGVTSTAAGLSTGEENFDITTGQEWNKHYLNNLYFTTNLLSGIKYGSSINMRKEGCIDLKGFQIDIHACNTCSRKPVELHYAVLGAKSEAVTATSSGIKTDFFRHYGTSTARDFNNAATGICALSGMEMCNNPINTDLWHVITHKHIMLGPGQGAKEQIFEPYPTRATDNTAANCHFAKIWVPFNKQIRYNNPSDNTSATPCDDIRLVWWFADPFTYGVTKNEYDALSTAEQTALEINYLTGNNASVSGTVLQYVTLFHSRAIAYYKDP